MVLPPSWVATGPGPVVGAGTMNEGPAPRIDRWRRADLSDACVRPAPQRAGVHSVTVEKRSRRLAPAIFSRSWSRSAAIVGVVAERRDEVARRLRLRRRNGHAKRKDSRDSS